MGLGALPPNHPKIITSTTIAAKNTSAKNLASTQERFDVSRAGIKNKQAIDKPIMIAPPILLGIDLRIA